jgi:hypothetical protein
MRQGATNTPDQQFTILEMKKNPKPDCKNFKFSRGVPSGYYLIIKDMLNC